MKNQMKINKSEEKKINKSLVYQKWLLLHIYLHAKRITYPYEYAVQTIRKHGITICCSFSSNKSEIYVCQQHKCVHYLIIRRFNDHYRALTPFSLCCSQLFIPFICTYRLNMDCWTSAIGNIERHLEKAHFFAFFENLLLALVWNYISGGDFVSFFLFGGLNMPCVLWGFNWEN